MCRILQIKSTWYSQQCRYVHINRTKLMPTSSHPTPLLQEQIEHRSGRVSSVRPGQPLCPTASSSPSPRRAPLSVRGRRGGTSVCESRPRCTVCTKPKKKKKSRGDADRLRQQGQPAQRAVCFGHWLSNAVSKKGKKKKK